MMNRIWAFLGAVAATFAIGSIAATQWNLAALVDMGLEVGFGTRLAATGHDLLWLVPTYGALVAVGLLIAFGVATLIGKQWSSLRVLAFVLAGAAALLTLHVAMHAAFQMHPIPATRTMPGLIVQVLAGAVGGWVFTRLRSTGNGQSPVRA